MEFVISALSLLPASLKRGIGQAVFLAAARKQYPKLPSINPKSIEERLCLKRLGMEVRNSICSTSKKAIRSTSNTSNKNQTFFSESLVPPEITEALISDDTTPSQSPAPSTISAISERVISEEEVARVFETAKQRCRMSINTSSLSSSDSDSLKSLREMASRSIQHLAEGLYSERVHFMLELLQNADDNYYAQDVIPTLRIVIENNKLIFFNNELGFSTDDVLSLCSVGASTKKGVTGFIGHKGIGWKSCFKVSKKPEVHSGPFHFRFDITSDILGYVIPMRIYPPPGRLGTNKLDKNGIAT